MYTIDSKELFLLSGVPLNFRRPLAAVFGTTCACRMQTKETGPR